MDSNGQIVGGLDFVGLSTGDLEAAAAFHGEHRHAPRVTEG